LEGFEELFAKIFKNDPLKLASGISLKGVSLGP